jgi:hypothetical protein
MTSTRPAPAPGSTPGLCEDVAMPIAVLTVLIYLARRIKPTTVALVMFEAWRRLPPEQRQQLILAARRNGPRVASSLMRRGRTRV